MCAACWDCVSQMLLKVQKASKKALAHLKDLLERYQRPIQATQMTPGPFWTRQKRLEACQTLKKYIKIKSIAGAPQFTEPLKRL